MTKQRFSAVLSLALCLIMVCACVASCSATDKVKKQYLGIWDVTKIVAGSMVVEFGDTGSSVLRMEMTVEFKNDDTYVIHYYVNGKEGDKYPQSGTYTIEDEVLVMSNGMSARVEGDDLTMNLKDGSKQYCTRRK